MFTTYATVDDALQSYAPDAGLAATHAAQRPGCADGGGQPAAGS